MKATPVCSKLSLLALGKGPPESLVWVPLSTLYFAFKRRRPRRRRCLQALLKGCRALLSVEVADGFSERSCSERWKASSSWLSHASTGCEALPSVCCAMSPDSKTVGQMLLLKCCRFRVLWLNPHREVTISHQRLRSLAAETIRPSTRHCPRKTKRQAQNYNIKCQNPCAEQKEKHSMQTARVRTHKRHPVRSPHAYRSHGTGQFSSCTCVTAMSSQKVRDATWASLRLHWRSQRGGQVERGLDGAPRQALGVLASTTTSFFSHLPRGPRARGRRRREASTGIGAGPVATEPGYAARGAHPRRLGPLAGAVEDRGGETWKCRTRATRSSRGDWRGAHRVENHSSRDAQIACNRSPLAEKPDCAWRPHQRRLRRVLRDCGT